MFRPVQTDSGSSNSEAIFEQIMDPVSCSDLLSSSETSTGESGADGSEMPKSLLSCSASPVKDLKSSRGHHQRTASPGYIVHVNKCKQVNENFRMSGFQLGVRNSPLAESFEGDGARFNDNEDGSNVDEVDEDVWSLSSSPTGSSSLCNLDMALLNLRLASPGSHLKHDSFRTRTLSASSKASVDSLRASHFSPVCPNPSVATNKCPTSPLASPLSIGEVYEVSRYIDNGTGPTAVVKNPNKALLTIDKVNLLIVSANNVASSVFGYEQSELLHMRFNELLTTENYLQELNLVEEHCGSDGKHHDILERLLIGKDKLGDTFPISLWLRPIPSTTTSDQYLAVIEPVERTTGVLTCSLSGDIVDADPQLAPVLGFHIDPGKLLECPISALMPNLTFPSDKAEVMPENLRCQHVTGQIGNGRKLPLTVLLRFADEETTNSFHGAKFPDEHSVYEFESDIHLLVIMYHNLTSLLTASLDGSIASCDSSFCTMLFGYGPEELVGKNVDDLVPGLMPRIQDARLKVLRFGVSPYFSGSTGGWRSGCPTNESRVSMTSGLHSRSSVSMLRQTLVQDSIPEDCSSECSVESGPDEVSASVTERQQSSGFSNPSSQSTEAEVESKRREVLESQERSLSNFDTADWESSTQSDKAGDSACSISKTQSHSSTLKRAKHVRSSANHNSKAVVMTSPSESACSYDAAYPFLSSENIYDWLNNVSTPSCSPNDGLPLATIVTTAKHKDDFGVDVIVQAKCVLFEGDTTLLCLWIKRDFGEDHAAAATSPCPSLDDSKVERCSSQDVIDDHSEEAFLGPYTENYTTLKTIGKGAFGDVKLAVQKKSGKQVIVKCIGKKDVLSCSWTSLSQEEHEKLNIVARVSAGCQKVSCVPTELYLLRTLNHPNIVSLVSVFETDYFYQLVMPKHGAGMDLFEFIDKEPAIDEPLEFYIFSQVVDAVEYLHGRNIIHRDIKDENIILNEDFQVKLIDFGSAAFMKEGDLFDSFCGTIEYCSPEVLSGNKYQGPELEMWTLGVTLYTLVFFENPFNDADDVITGPLDPPFRVSAPLTRVLLWLLHPDPASRCSIKQLRECPWMKQKVDISKYDFYEVLEKLEHREHKHGGSPRVYPQDDITRLLCRSH